MSPEEELKAARGQRDALLAVCEETLSDLRTVAMFHAQLFPGQDNPTLRGIILKLREAVEEATR
jgi:hypothetical protein